MLVRLLILDWGRVFSDVGATGALAFAVGIGAALLMRRLLARGRQ